MEIKALPGVMRKLVKASARTGITHTNAAALARVLTQPRNVQGISSILREEVQHPAALIDIRQIGSIIPARVEDLLLSLPFNHVPGLTDVGMQVREVKIEGEGLLTESEAELLMAVFRLTLSVEGFGKVKIPSMPTHEAHFKLNIQLRGMEIRCKMQEIGAPDFLHHLPDDKKLPFKLLMLAIKNDHSVFFHSLELFQEFEKLFTVEFSTWLKTRVPGDKFKILDIGPGLGEESYTLAMLIAKAMIENFNVWKISDPSEYVEIVAIDYMYEPHMLDFVNHAHYPLYARQEIPDQYYWPLILYRLLSLGEKFYAINPAVQKMVQFKRVDLFKEEETQAVFAPEDYQMVFCLRVLDRILSSAAEKENAVLIRRAKEVVKTIESGQLLRPQGYYFTDCAKRRSLNNRLLREFDFYQPAVNLTDFEAVADFSESSTNHGIVLRKKD